jgi:hypothetical protein
VDQARGQQTEALRIGFEVAGDAEAGGDAEGGKGFCLVECQGRGEQFDPLVARSLGDRLELGIGDALGQSHGQK